jgi:hypothetical protein
MVEFEYRRANRTAGDCSQKQFRFRVQVSEWSKWVPVAFPAWVQFAGTRYIGFGSGEHKGKVFRVEFVGRGLAFEV